MTRPPPTPVSVTSGRLVFVLSDPLLRVPGPLARRLASWQRRIATASVRRGESRRIKVPHSSGDAAPCWDNVFATGCVFLAFVRLFGPVRSRKLPRCGGIQFF